MKLLAPFLLAAAAISLPALAGAQAASPAAPVAAAVPIPVEDFLRLDRFGSLRLSPNGDYLAATVPGEDRTSLVIVRLSDMQVTANVGLEEHAHVDGIYWVNPTRLLFTASKRIGLLSDPQGIPGIFGVNADGSGAGRVDSQLTEGVGNSHLSDRVYRALIDTLRQDDDEVLVSTMESAGRNAGQRGISRMNVRHGGMRLVTLLPDAVFGSVAVDNAGEPRLLIGGRNNELGQRLYVHNSVGNWSQVGGEGQRELRLGFLGFSADNRTAFLELEHASGPNSVQAMDMQTLEMRQVLRDDNVDPAGALRSPIDGGVYAIRFEDGFPRYEIIDAENPFAQDLQRMQATFPESDVYPVSHSSDGKVSLYFAGAAEDPGQYFLYRRDSGQASPVFRRYAWLPQERMARQAPIDLVARDGVALQGFLSLPHGVPTRNLPLVVLPHGGPFRVQESWGFDREAQLLASRGYAVLQVNFRGSGGYGREFEVRGYRQWGLAMQDDLADATRWVISKGIADPARVCIYGHSYGAYAALMGPVRDPGLYRCAIGNVGVYDLPTLVSDGTWGAGWRGEDYFELTMGDDNLSGRSPNNIATQVRVPVLLGAGREDETAPPRHTEMMRDALQRAGTPVEAVIYPREGHGYYLMANRLDWANRVLAFLDRHIGAGANAVPAGEAAPAR
jgi:acetyl esterase/lipase